MTQAIVGLVYPHTRKLTQRAQPTIEALRHPGCHSEPKVKREGGVALHVRAAEDVVAGEGNVALAGTGGFMSPTSGEGILRYELGVWQGWR